MAYETADIEEFTFTDATFGGTTVTHTILGPRGKVGFVHDISVDVSTSLVGTTTFPEIDIGFSSGDTTFGRYRLGINSAAATGGASNAYGLGMHRASLEQWTGNPPRNLQDFAHHVELDGYPLDSNNRVPKGRIPAAGMQVTNVVSGTGSNGRIFIAGGVPQNVVVGMVLHVHGILGATMSGMTVGTAVEGYAPISVVDPNGQYIELSGTTFGGTYTSGGLLDPLIYVTNAAGAGSPAGGGQVRVKIKWVGAESV